MNIFSDIVSVINTVSIFNFLIYNYPEYCEITTLVISIQCHLIRDDLHNPKSH